MAKAASNYKKERAQEQQQKAQEVAAVKGSNPENFGSSKK